ncbi:MAG: hypothetical protein IPL32_17470 [Chloracidobacterium sp.]|nr:hypothetical protein [Chloracidobacterium sp.]
MTKLTIEEILTLPVMDREATMVQGLKCDKPTKPGMYLYLYHGREYAEEEMSDWGDDGPYLGPFEWMACTYMSDLRFGDDEGDAISIGCPVCTFHNGSTKPVSFRAPIFVWEDMIYYDGMFYGDWSFQYYKGETK